MKKKHNLSHNLHKRKHNILHNIWLFCLHNSGMTEINTFNHDKLTSPTALHSFKALSFSFHLIKIGLPASFTHKHVFWKLPIAYFETRRITNCTNWLLWFYPSFYRASYLLSRKWNSEHLRTHFNKNQYKYKIIMTY